MNTPLQVFYTPKPETTFHFRPCPYQLGRRTGSWASETRSLL